jgi:nucleotide-binding universal stress UspA family protein
MEQTPDLNPIAVGVDGSAPSLTPLPWNPEEEARSVCAAAVAEAFDGAPPAGLEMVTSQGPPAKALVEESSTAQTVIGGSRGRGGFEGLLPGAVSATVAEHAKCPVLVVHGTDLPAVLSVAPGQLSAEGGGQTGSSHAPA